MTENSPDVKNVDITPKKGKGYFSSTPFRIRERIKTWKGCGWGFKFERKCTETTTEVVRDWENDRR